MDDIKSQPFVHARLDLQAHEFRLIKLMQRKNKNEPIRCTLEHKMLESEHSIQSYSFTALSYAWGDPHQLKTISINGKPFAVRRNLYDFLYSASKTNLLGDKWVWIDQICIDQNHTRERNHQVNQMAWIYSAAREVLIWLGPAFHGSDVLMDSIYMHESYSTKDFLSTVRYKVDLSFEVMRKGSQIPLAWQHLAALEYWTRLWICQEIVLARRVTLVLGKYWVHWEDFCRHFNEAALQRCFDEPMRSRIGQLRIQQLEEYRNEWHNPSAFTDGLDWHSAIDLTKGSHCQEPLDHIYGLNGLITPSMAIKANYSKSRKEVFFEVAHVMQARPHYAHHADAYGEFVRLLRTELGLDDKISVTELDTLEREVKSGMPRWRAWGF